MSYPQLSFLQREQPKGRDFQKRSLFSYEVAEDLPYADENLRTGGEFALRRARKEPGQGTVLVVAPVSDRPSLASLARLEHEYSLRDQLDRDWAVRPLALAHREGRRALVLEDPAASRSID